MKTLYHPNALPAHIREQLPNPSRPIDEPVVPAMVKLFDEKFDPIYQDLAENFSQKNDVVNNPLPNMTTAESVLIFLKNYQNQAPDNGNHTGLNLTNFFKAIRPLGQAIIKTVVTNHPDFYPNLTENRLLMTAQFWQNLLALFLLAHCKTRKTLNHDLTLARLSQQMNDYLAKNARHIEFLTHDKHLQISPDNVAFAVLALDGKLSKTGMIGERVTNLSVNNFLTKFK